MMISSAARRIVLPAVAVFASLLAAGTPGAAKEKEAATAKQVERPNVVFILVDDLGWTDLGCFGSTLYETPNIDRLAAEGMRFTAGYAACTVCSPTRAAVMTGRYPARLHLTDWIAGHNRPRAKLRIPDWTKQLETSETTVAEALKRAGYATCSIGKWHLGGEGFYPTDQGFDENHGGTHRGQPPSYFAPYRIPTLPDGAAGEYLTDRESAEAVRFIRKHRDGPFFLYLPHYAVHTPLQAKKTLVEKYREKVRPTTPQRNPTYAAMIESVDESVGRILKTLDELKLDRRTIVFFTSDNGGLTLRNVTSNRPLRAGKGSAYEGGVRVPLAVRAPGRIDRKTTCDVPVVSVDFFPTILELAGAKGPANTTIDGESIVPLLTGSGTLDRDAVFWHYPHYHPGGATPYGAVRAGDWKLIEFFEDDHLELYELKNDIGESHNRAADMPERASRLHKRLIQWRTSVGAQMPTPNPNYQRPEPKK